MGRAVSAGRRTRRHAGLRKGRRPHSPAPEEGDLLAVRSAGAYGFVMNSNYNTRCRAAEVLADGSATQALRRRETRHELFAGESLLPD